MECDGMLCMFLDGGCSAAAGEVLKMNPYVMDFLLNSNVI